MKSAMTPDVDKIAELVANKLEARQIAKETFENSEFVQKRFTLPGSPENNTNEAVPKGFGLLHFRKENTMTMKLSNKFNEIRQNFLNAVANGAPQEEQAKLYNEMIESMTNEMMEQARTAAHEEVSAMNPYDAKLTAEAREFFNDIEKTAPVGRKNSSHKKPLTVSLTIW